MEFKINLKLLYHDDEVHSEFVNNAIKAVNDAYYSSELVDLKKIQDEIYRIIDKYGPIAKAKHMFHLENGFSEIKSKIDKYRDASVLIKEAKEGSLEFTIIGTGLGLWLLQLTFGQTIKEAWVKTNIHKGLVGLLTNKIFYKKKAEQISQLAENKLKRIPNSEITTNLKEFLDSENPEMIIEIKVSLKPEDGYPPSFGVALNNFRKIGLKELR